MAYVVDDIVSAWGYSMMGILGLGKLFGTFGALGTPLYVTVTVFRGGADVWDALADIGS